MPGWRNGRRDGLKIRWEYIPWGFDPLPRHSLISDFPRILSYSLALAFANSGLLRVCKWSSVGWSESDSMRVFYLIHLHKLSIVLQNVGICQYVPTKCNNANEFNQDNEIRQWLGFFSKNDISFVTWHYLLIEQSCYIVCIIVWLPQAISWQIIKMCFH